MSDIEIKAVPLTAETFLPYGTVLTIDPDQRKRYPEATEPGDVPGKITLSVARHRHVAAADLRVFRLERHPHTSQSFLPLASGRWLVLVAPERPDGQPDVGKARAFVAGPSDALCYARGVWHAGMTVLDEDADMACVMWSADSGADTVFADLEPAVRVAL